MSELSYTKDLKFMKYLHDLDIKGRNNEIKEWKIKRMLAKISQVNVARAMNRKPPHICLMENGGSVSVLIIFEYIETIKKLIEEKKENG